MRNHRMRTVMHFLQFLGRNTRIDFRRIQILVSQQCLYITNTCTILQRQLMNFLK